MSKLNFTVDKAKCTRCGTCVSDCASNIIEKSGRSFPRVDPGQEENCLECQHCLAVCPAGAISVFGLKPEDSLELKAGLLPSFEAESRLVRGRRSVRRYQSGNVSPDLIRRILAATAHAPTGVNTRSLCFTLIDDEQVMKRFRGQLMDKLHEALQAGRTSGGLDFLADEVAEYRKSGADGILRGAPHALIVSTASSAPCAAENVTIALAYFELLAQSAGLGTVWCGMLKIALEAIPELKALLGLPPDHSYYCMLFGHPAVHYERTVQRDNEAAVKHVKL